jgi:hypothetical protein
MTLSGIAESDPFSSRFYLLFLVLRDSVWLFGILIGFKFKEGHLINVTYAWGTDFIETSAGF